jgi:uncharacterized protein YdaU (DUF1376 family)
MNYYPFHIGDWISHTAHLDELQELAYFRILNCYYLNESLPYKSPDDVAKRIRMAKMPSVVESVLTEFFTKTEDGYIQNRVEEEIAKFKEKSEKMKRNANKRWNANAEQKQSNGKAKGMLTNNQEPIPNTQEPKRGVADAPARFSKPEQIDVQEYFLSIGMDGMEAFREAKKFVNHYGSVGWVVGKNKPMKDWQASARGWKSRQEEFKNENTKRDNISTDSEGWSAGIEIPR